MCVCVRERERERRRARHGQHAPRSLAHAVGVAALLTRPCWCVWGSRREEEEGEGEKNERDDTLVFLSCMCECVLA